MKDDKPFGWTRGDDGCSCRHSRREHTRSGKRKGKCKGLDSYDCPCACPSFERQQED